MSSLLIWFVDLFLCLRVSFVVVRGCARRKIVNVRTIYSVRIREINAADFFVTFIGCHAQVGMKIFCYLMFESNNLFIYIHDDNGETVGSFVGAIVSPV